MQPLRQALEMYFIEKTVVSTTQNLNSNIFVHVLEYFLLDLRVRKIQNFIIIKVQTCHDLLLWSTSFPTLPSNASIYPLELRRAIPPPQKSHQRIVHGTGHIWRFTTRPDIKTFIGHGYGMIETPPGKDSMLN